MQIRGKEVAERDGNANQQDTPELPLGLKQLAMEGKSVSVIQAEHEQVAMTQ